jgi:uncharacterized membrane protein
MNFKTKNNLYTSGDMKREAKAQLSGHWGQSVLLAALPTIFTILFIQSTTESIIWSSIFDIIQSFLVIGVTFGFMNLLRNQAYHFNGLQEIVSAFRSKYFKNLLFLIILKYFLIFLWTLLFIIPGIVKALGYAQAERIYKDRVDQTGEQPSPHDCLAESQQLMYGSKVDLFVLDLSFIGWSFLNYFTFGILGLWLTPYMEMSQVVFYENISEGSYLRDNRQNEHSDRESEEADEYNEEIGRDPDDFRDFDDF